MFQLQLIYIKSGKKYTLPMEILESCIDSETLEKIKVEALREVQKL